MPEKFSHFLSEATPKECVRFHATPKEHRGGGIKNHKRMRIRRVYRYLVDLHGKLFLDELGCENFHKLEHVKKSAPRPLTDVKFLNMFWKNLQKSQNLIEKHDDLESIISEYPFVSICAGELNFVRAVDTILVFDELIDGQLYFAGKTRSCVFDPSTLVMKSSTQRLYHPILDEKIAQKLEISLGLIQSHLAQKIAEKIVPLEEDGQLVYKDNESIFPIRYYRVS
jgi:hypothetical protein